MPVTGRLALPYPVRPDSADVPRDVQALAEAADIAVVGYSGPFTSRPPAGLPFRLWVATDKTPGDPDFLTMDTGTTWVVINFTLSIPDRSIAAIKLILNTITQLEMGPNSVGPPQLINGSVIASKIANAAIQLIHAAPELRPSQGAADGVEALRALGPATGRAAPGIHASQHLPTGADPLPHDYIYRSVRGAVDSSGHPIAGSGFTCTRASMGVYTLQFNTLFATVPRIQVTSDSINAVARTNNPRTVGQLGVAIYGTGASSDPVDAGFDFFAYEV